MLSFPVAVFQIKHILYTLWIGYKQILHMVYSKLMEKTVYYNMLHRKLKTRIFTVMKLWSTSDKLHWLDYWHLYRAINMYTVQLKNNIYLFYTCSYMVWKVCAILFMFYFFSARCIWLVCSAKAKNEWSNFHLLEIRWVKWVTITHQMLKIKVVYPGYALGKLPCSV